MTTMEIAQRQFLPGEYQYQPSPPPTLFPQIGQQQFAQQQPLTQAGTLASIPNQTPKSYTNPFDFEGLNFASSDTAFRQMPMFRYAEGTSEEDILKSKAPYMTRDNYEKQLNYIRSRNESSVAQQNYNLPASSPTLPPQIAQRPLPPTPSNPPTLPPQIGQQQFGNSGIGSLGGGGGGGGQTNVSLNLQGSATMNPQGANQNRGYPGMNFASAQQQDQSRGTMMFAEGGPAQQGVGSLDRGRTGIREIDIINAYFRSANVSPEQALQIIKSAVQSGVKFKRFGNTILGYKPLSQTAMQIYYFSVDEPQALASAIGQSLSMMKKAGVQTAYLSKEDPLIASAMQTVGASIQPSDIPKYQVMVKL